MGLVQKRCIPCEADTPPLTAEEVTNYKSQVSNWTVSADKKSISKEFRFKDFAQAFAFAGKIAAIAQAEGHHPDLSIGWGRVGVELSTHAIKGLSENDFILAAKLDSIQ